MPAERRDYTILFRVTAEEKAVREAAAKESGMKFSDWCRQRTDPEAAVPEEVRAATPPPEDDDDWIVGDLDDAS